MITSNGYRSLVQNTPCHDQGLYLVSVLSNALAPRVGLDPAIIPAIALLETGRAESTWCDRIAQGWALWGVRGEWGPILSGRTAEALALPSVRVDRDYAVTRSSNLPGGGVSLWRAYPGPVHAVADMARMLSSGRYAGARGLPAPIAAGEIWQAGYTHEPAWPGIVGDFALRLSA